MDRDETEDSLRLDLDPDSGCYHNNKRRLPLSNRSIVEVAVVPLSSPRSVGDEDAVGGGTSSEETSHPCAGRDERGWVGSSTGRHVSGQESGRRGDGMDQDWKEG